MCLSHLIYTVRPCLIHTCHTMPMPCSDNAVLLKATAQHGLLSTAVLCCGLEKNGMASVNQTRPHCVNQMGKTHSKHLAARHVRGTAWEWHAMCVNRPLLDAAGSFAVKVSWMVSALEFLQHKDAQSMKEGRVSAHKVPNTSLWER